MGRGNISSDKRTAGMPPAFFLLYGGQVSGGMDTPELQVYQQQVTLLPVSRGLGCAGSRQAQQGLQAR